MSTSSNQPFLTSVQKRLMTMLAVILALESFIMLVAYMIEVSHGAAFGGDFAVFWNAAQQIVTGNIDTLYDPSMLQAALGETAGTQEIVAPFVYPPPITLFLWPLGFFEYHTAVALWTIIPIIVFYLLLWKVLYYSQHDAQKFFWMAALYTLPFITVNILSGQTGAWLAILFLGGMYGWQRKQWWSGIYFGLMIIKPQLLILIPFALICSKEWRIITVAIITAIVLCVLASAMLGLSIWFDYFTILYWFSRFAHEGFAPFAALVTGPFMSLNTLGLPMWLSIWVQATISLFVLMIIIHIFKHSPVKGLDMRLGLVTCGTLLATPHSMAYDSPIMAVSVAVLFFSIWHSYWKDKFELFAFVSILLMPFLQPLAMQISLPLGWVMLLIFFIALLRRYSLEYQPVK